MSASVHHWFDLLLKSREPYTWVFVSQNWSDVKVIGLKDEKRQFIWDDFLAVSLTVLSCTILTKLYFEHSNIVHKTKDNRTGNQFQSSTKIGHLTLLEAASGMHPEWQGGAFKVPPYKNQFRGNFDPIFLHSFYWGTKIT